MDKQRTSQCSLAASRQRLLVLTSTYPRWLDDPEPGFVHELSKRLTAAFEVHVLCPHSPSTVTYEIMEGVHIHRFRYAPSRLETLVHGGGIVNNLRCHPWKWALVPMFLFGLAWQTAQSITRLRPACLHVHWIIPQGLALSIVRPFIRVPPFLLTSHGGDLFGLRGRLAGQIKREVARQASAITVVSRAMLEPARALAADPKKLSVVPMGVDFTGRFQPIPDAARIPDRILFVGRLVEKKGLRHLLDAMPAILAVRPGARLQIVGYGPEEAALRSKTSRLGIADAVEFLGALPQSELPALYCQASLFVAPFVRASSGDQDGLPVALMEAIACACPVLAGDLPALDDIFSYDEADMRVISTDITALADRVLAALADPARTLDRAEKLRRRLATQLDWSTIAGQYTDLLRRLI